MPQSVIGNLRAVLGINTGQFTSGLKQADGALGGFAKKIGVSLAGAAAAATAAATAVAFAVKGQLNAADELGKTAQKVGVSVEALSRLKYAAELSDISLEGLAGGLKKLGVNMNAVASGGAGPAAAAFQTLGISATTANGQLKSSDVVLSEVADKFAGMRDGAQKTALAVALFGKSGSDLIPLLNAGASGLAAMGDEAAQLGLVIDTQTAKSAEEFNDNLTRLGKVSEGITTQLAAALAPALASISAALVNTAKNTEAMKAVGMALGVTLRALASIVVGLGTAFAVLGNGIKTAVAVARAALSGDLSGAVKAYANGAADAVKIIAGGAGSITKIWTDAGTATAAAAPKIAADLAAPITQGATRAKKSAKVIETETDKAVEAARALITAQQKALDDKGLTREQVDARELLAAASTLVAAGYLKEAAAAARLADELGRVEKVQRKVVDLNPDFVRTPADLAEGIDRLADRRSTIDQIADAFYGISDSLSGAARSFKSGDFVGVIGQAGQALKGLKDAFAKGSSFASKAGAVGAIGQVAGSLIGGKAGGAISGAASGLAAGAAFGPIGAGIGAVAGGLLGLFGASKAKKAAKKEAAERARLEAEQKAREEAATKRELEIQLIEASGDAIAAQTEREKDLLATLSPANAELQKQIWVQEKAAEMAAARRAIETELLEATGQSAEALARLRAEELKALPPELRALQQSLYDVVDATAAAETAQAALVAAEATRDDARSDLSEAYEREASAIETVRDRFADLADTLADFGRELASGDLAGLNPTQQLNAARAAFDAVAGKTDAESLAALPEAGRALIEASRAAAPNAAAAARDTAAVRAAVQAGEIAARSQVSIAQLQLNALTAQVEGYITLNESVLSVRDAISGLAEAMAAVAAAANDNARADDARKLAGDVAKTAAALTAVTGAGAATATGATAPTVSLVQSLDDQQAMLMQLVINTGLTARTLDDVTQGGDSFKTVAA